MKKLRFRWFNKHWAKLCGKFWLPCPLCGKDFGGHEWARSGYPGIPTDHPREREGICVECEQRGLSVWQE